MKIGVELVGFRSSSVVAAVMEMHHFVWLSRRVRFTLN
jgi:hypothetical protein